MSHQATKYLWSLIDKLSEALGMESVDVYKEMLKRNRNFLWVLVETDRANDFIAQWTAHGSGWMAVRAKDQENGTAIKAYKGVSLYDTKELTALIRLIQEECKKYGIETMTEQELELLQRYTQ